MLPVVEAEVHEMRAATATVNAGLPRGPEGETGTNGKLNTAACAAERSGEAILPQDATSGAMIFDIREQIAYLSSILTLKPGDVLATGTPTGVGMSRGIFLKPGDVMTASIESIGTLRSPVAAETS